VSENDHQPLISSVRGQQRRLIAIILACGNPTHRERAAKTCRRPSQLEPRKFDRTRGGLAAAFRYQRASDHEPGPAYSRAATHQPRHPHSSNLQNTDGQSNLQKCAPSKTHTLSTPRQAGVQEASQHALLVIPHYSRFEVRHYSRCEQSTSGVGMPGTQLTAIPSM